MFTVVCGWWFWTRGVGDICRVSVSVFGSSGGGSRSIPVSSPLSILEWVVVMMEDSDGCFVVEDGGLMETQQ
ncbi:hypothetical protein A2U01_0062764 [Trifolium medium]|uniref:Secreted protein n=1 Tax=Trifolium medium TaxID=97028 RepID=A0A392RY24_9FABA|nr:hypothetical protein [Trifolium medium]